MMDTLDILAVARQQQLRQVELVDIREGGCRVRIAVCLRAAATAITADTAPTTAARPAAAPDVSASDGVIVKAEFLGLLRRSHPSRAPVQVESGDAVAKGQPLALLEVRDVYTEVVSPCDGIVESVLADEGDLIDYGRPLFKLRAGTK